MGPRTNRDINKINVQRSNIQSVNRMWCVSRVPRLRGFTPGVTTEQFRLAIVAEGIRDRRGTTETTGGMAGCIREEGTQMLSKQIVQDHYIGLHGRPKINS